jgi:hypothetical protein
MNIADSVVVSSGVVQGDPYIESIDGMHLDRILKTLFQPGRYKGAALTESGGTVTIPSGSVFLVPFGLKGLVHVKLLENLTADIDDDQSLIMRAMQTENGTSVFVEVIDTVDGIPSMALLLGADVAGTWAEDANVNAHGQVGDKVVVYAELPNVSTGDASKTDTFDFSTDNTIVHATDSWVKAGFAVGDFIRISGTAGGTNNRFATIKDIGGTDDKTLTVNPHGADLADNDTENATITTVTSGVILSPVAGTITRIHSVLHGAITSAVATVDVAVIEDASAIHPMHDGMLTITHTGSALGDVDIATPLDPITYVYVGGSDDLVFKADDDTITRSDFDGSWVTAGFAVGDYVKITGTASNNVIARVTAVTATVLTLSAALADESIGASGGQDVTFKIGGTRTVKRGQAIRVHTDGGSTDAAKVGCFIEIDLAA